jgi:hypothetical protein
MEGSLQLCHPTVEPGTLAVELLAKYFKPGYQPRIGGLLSLRTQNASTNGGHISGSPE